MSSTAPSAGSSGCADIGAKINSKSGCILLTLLQSRVLCLFVKQVEKKTICEEEEKDNATRKRLGLSIPLVPEKEEDKKLASLLTFQSPECKRKFRPL